MTDLTGKTIVITGATSGIGYETALRLARMGARLAIVGRDRDRGEVAREALAREARGAEVVAFTADLSSMGETHRLAGELLAALPRIDVLVNNAGAMFAQRSLTVDGLERTFALNHMAYFLLTELLRDRLVASAPSRVVVVASEAHRRASLDLDDLQTEKGYTGWLAYCRSKLANILFTRALARRLDGTGVSAHCLHPGFVASGFGDDGKGVFRFGFGLAKRLFAIPVDEGARTSVHLASADGLVSGGYYVKCAIATPSPQARDDQAAEHFWDDTVRFAAMHAR
ncbi:SDR family oxidoreductase [Xanthobacteraceae bacterium Astr-EGSB]|uniref:SDR family oxidoreductase n=1 Tax=Astrobacterium formosum TaxID=3069710 RepID=UPI0027B8460F|nr:SDR family oxidoreductase [Xanthobacteraceae bacterium Astr-EGSB]